ncbi:MAG: hypothetical protein K6A14_04625 [Erysipelotrichaceae bacterium]|nr:hypothetical protein [Erysipelotrichaceae bacterium]
MADNKKKSTGTAAPKKSTKKPGKTQKAKVSEKPEKVLKAEEIVAEEISKTEEKEKPAKKTTRTSNTSKSSKTTKTNKTARTSKTKTSKTKAAETEAVKAEASEQPKQPEEVAAEVIKEPQAEKQPEKPEIAEEHIDEEVKAAEEISASESVEDKPAEPVLKTGNKKRNRIIAIAAAAVVLLVAGIYLLMPRFQDLTIEAGSPRPHAADFLRNEKNAGKAEAISDLSLIDTCRAGSHEVELKWSWKTERVILTIEDTIAPKVETRKISASVDYVPNPYDFLVSVEDVQPTIAFFDNDFTVDSYGNFEVPITVRDASGNETKVMTELYLSWLLDEYTLEIGDKLDAKDLVFHEEDAKYISAKDLAAVDQKKLGTYSFTVNRDGQDFTCQVTVADTTPPVLTVKNVEVYQGMKKSYTADSFVKSVSDNSGSVTVKMDKELNTRNIGTITVTITATDSSGNKTVKTASFTVKKDNVGPVFSGLRTLTVKKKTNIDYKKGVKATDEVDGACSFTVDYSNVDTSKYGTYYAIYTSTDTKGNKTTAKRKIEVLHDSADTQALFEEYYEKNLKGKSLTGMFETVRKQIAHRPKDWGGSDPVWYGLTKRYGNCYVRSNIMKLVLNKLGYANKLIHTTHKIHYWNLVKISGTWYHMDATPNQLLGPVGDKEKYNFLMNKYGEAWDESQWPIPE